MIFDRLCGVAERHLPALKPILNKCSLFLFPGLADKVLPGRFEGLTAEEATFLWEEFRLPYRYMAVEDPESVVVIWEEEEDLKGLQGVRRYVMEATPMSEDQVALGNVPEAVARGARRMHDQHGDLLLISVGEFEGVSLDSAARFGTQYSCTAKVVFTATKALIIQGSDTMLSRGGAQVFSQTLGTNAKACVEEIMWFNTPGHFVVRDTPLKCKVQKGRIARSDQRPLHTLLTPKEIREKHSMGAEVGSKKASHDRRGHWREYRSDRFSEAVRNKPRWIKAHWVGDSEFTKGRRRYEVLLDV